MLNGETEETQVCSVEIRCRGRKVFDRTSSDAAGASGANAGRDGVLWTKAWAYRSSYGGSGARGGGTGMLSICFQNERNVQRIKYLNSSV
jgi:hypothetical protein